MKRQRRSGRDLLRDGDRSPDAGLESVEYALIVAVILGALFVIFPVFGNNLAPVFNNVMNALITALN